MSSTEPASTKLASPTRPSHPMYRPHGGGSSTHMVRSGRVIVRHTYGDDVERGDEYDMSTGQLLVRRWRTKTALGGTTPWEYEIGDAASAASESAAGAGREAGMVESSSMPVVSRRDTATTWEFRIRNLPYPIETYQLSVDPASQSIVVRTTNKKYFKKLDIPAMWRAHTLLSEESLSMEHNVNTLIIRYSKPEELKLAEQEEREQLLERVSSSGDAGVGCRTQ